MAPEALKIMLQILLLFWTCMSVYVMMLCSMDFKPRVDCPCALLRPEEWLSQIVDSAQICQESPGRAQQCPALLLNPVQNFSPGPGMPQQGGCLPWSYFYPSHHNLLDISTGWVKKKWDLKKFQIALTHSILKLKSIVIPLNQMSQSGEKHA